MLLKSLSTLFHFILGVNGAKYQDVLRNKTKILTPGKIRKSPVYAILNETASKSVQAGGYKHTMNRTTNTTLSFTRLSKKK